MTFLPYLNDSCVIQHRTVDPAGMTDNETWTDQATPSRCRVITQVNRRKTSPDSAEKVQYGTFIFLNIVLPKNAVIAAHDRIKYPVAGGRVYDVIGLSQGRDGKGVHHLVAYCDARA